MPLLLIAFLAFLAMMVGCTWVGALFVHRGLRAAEAPLLPPARLANLEGVDAACAKVSRIAAQAPRKLGRGLSVALGLGLLATPWFFVYKMVSG